MNEMKVMITVEEIRHWRIKSFCIGCKNLIQTKRGRNDGKAISKWRKMTSSHKCAASLIMRTLQIRGPLERKWKWWLVEMIFISPSTHAVCQKSPRELNVIPANESRLNEFLSSNMILSIDHPSFQIDCKYIYIYIYITISSCISVRMSRYWARGKLGEHERGVRVARGAAECNSSLLSALPTSQVLNFSTYAQLQHELIVL